MKHTVTHLAAMLLALVEVRADGVVLADLGKSKARVVLGGHGPAGERRGYPGTAAFDFEEGENDSLIGRESIEDAPDDLGGGCFVLTGVRVIEQRFCQRQRHLFNIAEIGGAKFGARGFVTMAVAADIECDARGPVLQRLPKIKRREVFEDSEEGLLDEVLHVVAL